MQRLLQNNNQSTLPAAPVAAIQHLIRISQSLLTIAEKETQALLTNDMLAFSIMQYEKEKLAGSYTQASEAFRARIEEFRNIDRALLNRLEQLQKDLAIKAGDNNALVEQIRQRAMKNTQKSVNSIREMSQNVHVRFEKPQEITITTEGA
jgi:hypothetical protein